MHLIMKMQFLLWHCAGTSLKFHRCVCIYFQAGLEHGLCGLDAYLGISFPFARTQKPLKNPHENIAHLFMF